MKTKKMFTLMMIALMMAMAVPMLIATPALADRNYGTWSTSDTDTDLLNGPWLETYGSGGPGSPGSLATGGVLMAIAEDSVPWSAGLFGQWRIGSFVCDGVSGGTGTVADPYWTYYSGGDMDLRAGESTLWGDGLHIDGLTALNKAWYTTTGGPGAGVLNWDFSFQAVADGVLWSVNATWSGVVPQFGEYSPFAMNGGQTNADAATLDALVTNDTDFDSPVYSSGMDFAISATLVGDISEVWVDDDYCDTCENEGHVWGYTAFDNIQDGIDGVSGSTVNVANGTYTEQLTITNKNITLDGESESGVIIEAGTTAPGSADTISIDANGYDVTIQDLTVRNGKYGIRSIEGNVDVLHCTFYHNGWDGTGATPTQSAMATLWGSSSTSNGGAMRIEDSGSSEIAYCTVYQNLRAIRYQDGDNGDIHDNEVYNNLESGIYLASLDQTGTYGCTNTEVYDNESYGNMNNGILSIGGHTNTIGPDNNVHDNWNTGVMIWSPSEITVQGNTIDNNNLYSFNGIGNPGDAYGGGICIDAAASVEARTFAVDILENTISNNNEGASSQTEGIRIDTPVPADGIDIHCNYFLNHDIDIYVRSQASTTDVYDNNFDGNDIGIQNDDSATLDAEDNWWGSAFGPLHANESGTDESQGAGEDGGLNCGDKNEAPAAQLGDEVIGPVAYCEWIDDDVSGCAPIPEVPTIIMLSLGLLGLCGFIWFRRYKNGASS